MNIHHNFQLQPYNSLQTKAKAKLFVETQTIEEIQEVLKQYPNEKKLVLGNGCNMFFTKNYDGIIIKPSLMGIKIIDESNRHVMLEVCAGEDWDTFVDYCVRHDWSGIENLSLIPGSVGAAPIQNIGAYGVEVKDVIMRVNTLDITSGEAKTFNNDECDFEYRDSLFKKTRQYIITSIVLRLNRSFIYKEKYLDLKNELRNTSYPSLKQVREALINIRQRKLPNHLELPNAGSFFKNPILDIVGKEQLVKLLPAAPIYDIGNGKYKTSAAYLIEQAGYKGRRIGNVGTYTNHALIIVNYGTDSGKDIESFKNEIQEVIKNKFNIWLEPEVWIF